MKFVNSHGKKIILAEDHYEEGGIGEMIAGVIAGKDIELEHLAVREIPHSGSGKQLMNAYKINSVAYVRAARKILGKKIKCQ